MSRLCPECGAPLEEGEDCRRWFDALLLLESTVVAELKTKGIDDGRGLAWHFLAVGAYALQHPETTLYRADALAGLRKAVADHLAGRESLDQLRRRVGAEAKGSRRVTRRPGDPIVRWRVPSWPLTVADVLAGGAEGYGDRVVSWATSILRMLDAVDPARE